MIFRPIIANTLEDLSRVNAAGISHSCPFCYARANKSLTQGERFLIVAGFNAGVVGEVVTAGTHGAGEILYRKADSQEPGLWRLIIHTDMFFKFPLPAIPAWALPLSVEDNCLVDDVLMRAVHAYSDFVDSRPDSNVLNYLVTFIWLHRLPVTAAALIGILEAHGLQNACKYETLKFIEFGLELLVWSNGKRPVKRRRMSSFSSARYVKDYKSPVVRALFGTNQSSHFGLLSTSGQKPGA